VWVCFRKPSCQMTVDRLNQCENIVALAKELGISQLLLYTWREHLEPTASGEGSPENAQEEMLRNLGQECGHSRVSPEGFTPRNCALFVLNHS
jgi:transposase-like protein